MSQDALTLLTLAGALIAYNPWLLLLLAVAVIPSFLGETHFASLGYSLLFRWTPERRQLDYLRYVGASDKTAKEVQMFGLAPWLTERYRDLSQKFYEENRNLSIRRGVVSALLSILGTVGYYAAYVVILIRAVKGDITIGTLTFLAASFGRGRDVIQSILLSASNVAEQALYLRDLFVFLEMRPTIESPPNARLVPAKIQSGFVFENVGFRYPGSEQWAIRNVDLVLRPGERVALVGENGAGKTTITKLLARLYDPTEGRITLDGVDLKEYNLASVRHAIGVIFQDFVRYDMRFDENIGVGEIDSVRADLDRNNGTPPAISAAAENSLAGFTASPLLEGLSADAGQEIRGGRRSVGRRMAEDRAGACLHPRRAGADSRRADGGARRARRVRGVPALLRAGCRPDGDPHLASLFDGANGRPDHRAAARQGRGAGLTRRAPRKARAVRGAVHDAGGWVPVDWQLTGKLKTNYN